MRSHTADESVQAHACSALSNICAGFDDAAKARRKLAFDAGALAAVEAAGNAEGRGKMALDVLNTDNSEAVFEAANEPARSDTSAVE